LKEQVGESYRVRLGPKKPKQQHSPLATPLAVGALLLAVFMVATIRRKRARYQRRWTRQHVRVEPHPSSDEVTVAQDPQSAPTYSVQLQPHGDAGTQTLEEGD
jgi:hypothetical protein